MASIKRGMSPWERASYLGHLIYPSIRLKRKRRGRAGRGGRKRARAGKGEVTGERKWPLLGVGVGVEWGLLEGVYSRGGTTPLHCALHGAVKVVFGEREEEEAHAHALPCPAHRQGHVSPPRSHGKPAARWMMALPLPLLPAQAASKHSEINSSIAAVSLCVRAWRALASFLDCAPLQLAPCSD